MPLLLVLFVPAFILIHYFFKKHYWYVRETRRIETAILEIILSIEVGTIFWIIAVSLILTFSNEAKILYKTIQLEPVTPDSYFALNNENIYMKHDGKIFQLKLDQVSFLTSENPKLEVYKVQTKNEILNFLIGSVFREYKYIAYGP